VLIGSWGGVDLEVDRVTLADKGGIVLRMFQDADVALRHPEAFSTSVNVAYT